MTTPDNPPEVANPARLDALSSYDILDTPAEIGFDDAVRLACELCATSIALISLVAGDRQWFKAKVGFEPCQTALSESICAYTLASPDVLIIPDLTLDPRTSRNALVAGEPYIRFYAGAPLRTADGFILGSLCVIDSKPRPQGLTPGQISALQALARQVMTLLELRKSVADREATLTKLHASESRYRAVFESAVDYAIVVMDLDGRVTNWNVGATRVFGWTPDEMIGQLVDTFFTLDDREMHIPAKEMSAALQVGRGVDERWHVRKDGTRFWANGEMMSLRNAAGDGIGFIKILRDRTEQKESAVALETSEANLRTILETVPLGILFAEAPSGRIVGGNARIEEILGHPIDKSGNSVAHDEWVAYHDDGRLVAPDEYPLAKVLSGVREASLEAHYRRPDGTRVWIDIVGAQVRSPDGGINGAVVAVSDIDDRKRAEAMQSLMNHELSHRMKNQLAMVQAIARQTMRGATDMASVRETLSNRLVALGKAHDILLDGMMDRSPLSTVLRGGIGVHDDPTGRFVYDGPHVEINGRAVLPLSLMLHELSTNAAKYGALSEPDGRVLLRWDVRDEGPDAILRIVWRECGGPPVEPPGRKGFGSWVIERGLTDQVGGTVALDFAASGLTCTVEAPLRGFQQAA